MRFLRHDMHSLSGAYALDALEGGAERDRFTRRMEPLPVVRQRSRGFREVATTLAIAATAEAPPELRDRVLAAAARTRQLPPEIRTHAQPRRTRRTVPWVPWLSGVVVAASIVAAVLFGFAQAHTQQELNQPGPEPGHRAGAFGASGQAAHSYDDHGRRSHRGAGRRSA